MTLEDFRGIHSDVAILVCGLGPSVELLTEPHRWITIGLNDISAKHFVPTYVLASENLPEARMSTIRCSSARAIFNDQCTIAGGVAISLEQLAGSNWRAVWTCVRTRFAAGSIADAKFHPTGCARCGWLGKCWATV
jgi:hypothetical protein